MKIINKILNLNRMETAILTLKNMIDQRKYKVIEETNEKIIAEKKTGEKLVVFTQVVQKFNVDKLKEYINTLNTLKINQCIIVYTDCITPMAKKLITISVDIQIQLFLLDELQYNITEHYLVPKHEALSPKEGKAFKEKYGIKFPVLLRTDPIARFYNFNRGDIIKVTRTETEKNGDKKQFIVYRIVKG